MSDKQPTPTRRTGKPSAEEQKMRLNKKMIGKQITVIATSETGFKRIVGILAGYRSGEVDIVCNFALGTYERSEGWKIESVK